MFNDQQTQLMQNQISNGLKMYPKKDVNEGIIPSNLNFERSAANNHT